jgi:hypothetical protein
MSSKLSSQSKLVFKLALKRKKYIEGMTFFVFPGNRYFVADGSVLLRGTESMVSDLVKDLEAEIVLLGITGPGPLVDLVGPLPPPGIDGKSNLVSMADVKRIVNTCPELSQVPKLEPAGDRAEGEPEGTPATRSEPYRLRGTELREPEFGRDTLTESGGRSCISSDMQVPVHAKDLLGGPMSALYDISLNQTGAISHTAAPQDWDDRGISPIRFEDIDESVGDPIDGG